MSMTPKGWSISALAVELGADRRTIARAIADADIEPLAGSAKLYRLRDVLDALAPTSGSGRRRGSGRRVPTAFELEDRRVLDRAFALLEGEVWRRAARMGLISKGEAEELAQQALDGAPISIPLHDDDEPEPAGDAAE